MYFNPLKKKTNSLTQAIFQFLVVGTLNDCPIQSDEMAGKYVCKVFNLSDQKREAPFQPEWKRRRKLNLSTTIVRFTD